MHTQGHNLERDASNHYRKIEALYDQLQVHAHVSRSLTRFLTGLTHSLFPPSFVCMYTQKLEHVESDLPGLVSRLQVLQDLHTQSLQFK